MNKIIESLGLRFVRNKIEDEIQHVGRHKDHNEGSSRVSHQKGCGDHPFGKFGCYPLKIENPEAIILASCSEHAEPPKA